MGRREELIARIKAKQARMHSPEEVEAAKASLEQSGPEKATEVFAHSMANPYKAAIGGLSGAGSPEEQAGYSIANRENPRLAQQIGAVLANPSSIGSAGAGALAKLGIGARTAQTMGNIGASTALGALGNPDNRLAGAASGFASGALTHGMGQQYDRWQNAKKAGQAEVAALTGGASKAQQDLAEMQEGRKISIPLKDLNMDDPNVMEFIKQNSDYYQGLKQGSMNPSRTSGLVTNLEEPEFVTMSGNAANRLKQMHDKPVYDPNGKWSEKAPYEAGGNRLRGALHEDAATSQQLQLMRERAEAAKNYEQAKFKEKTMGVKPPEMTEADALHVALSPKTGLYQSLKKRIAPSEAQLIEKARYKTGYERGYDAPVSSDKADSLDALLRAIAAKNL